jgi:hypothetical protein
VPKVARKDHPINMIRYGPVNLKKLGKNWEGLEKARFSVQLKEYMAKYPELVNDPVRLTGTFEQYKAAELQRRAMKAEESKRERTKKKDKKKDKKT